MKTILVVIGIALLNAPLRADSFSILNGGSVSGNPGDVVGWSFTFTSSDWSVLTFSDFTPLAPVGTYGDYIALPQNYYSGLGFVSFFDPIGQAGLGEFDISPGAVPGTIIAGTIRLHYDTYLFPPDFGGFVLGYDNFIDAPVTVTVTAATVAAPEPRLFWPAGFWIGVWALLRRRRFSRA